MTQLISNRSFSEKIQKIGPGLRKILGNMGWLMVDRVVRMGMGLFVGVWVARYLGPDRFGGLNFAVAYIALFQAVTTLGLDMIVVKELLEHTEHRDEIIGTTFALRSVGGLLGAVIAIVSIRLLQPSDRQAWLLVSIVSAMLVFQAFDAIDALFQSEVRSRVTVWAKNSAFLVVAVIRIVLIRSHAPLWCFAAAFSAEAALGAVGMLLGYRLSGGRTSLWRISKARSLRLLSQSWPLIFSGMAIMVYMRVDTVMLKVMQGDFAVGLYSAATRISEVWYFIPTAIVSSVSPAIIKAKHNRALFHDRLRKLFSFMTLTACLIGSLVALASHWIVRVLYSSGYSGAGSVLAVHVWASVFVFLGVAQSPWDVAENQLKLALYRTASGAVLNILMNLYLIPRYSAMGAAIATVVSYAVSGVIANLFFKQSRPIFYMQLRSFIPCRFWASEAN